MLFTVKTNIKIEILAANQEEALEYFRNAIIDRLTSAAAEKNDPAKEPRCISAWITGKGNGLMIKDGSALSGFKPVVN